MVNEYYVMPDGKIFCYDCWRYGKMEAGSFEQRKREQFQHVEMELFMFNERQKKAKRQLEELDDAIKIEKSRFLRDWQNYEEEYDVNKKPCNYTNVELLKEKRKTLYFQIQEAKSPISRVKPLVGCMGISYYTTARFISVSESQFYETVTLPAQRDALAQKAVEEQKRREVEAEKQRKEIEKRKAEAEKQRKEIEKCKAEAEKLRLNEIKRRNEREAAEMMKLKQSARIDSVWVEHNIIQNNQKGLRIHIRFQIFNMLSLVGEIAAYFYTKSGFWRNAKPLKDENNSYCSQNGQVSVGSTFIPAYQNCIYSNYELFIPYFELHKPKGKHDIMFSIEIFSYNKKSLASYWDKKGFWLEV